MDKPPSRHGILARQDWQNFSDHVQQDVDRTLVELSESTDYLNHRLYLARQDSPDEYTRVSHEILQSLDQLWEHHGDHFLVTGHWHAPHGEFGENYVRAEHQYEPAFKEGVSDGFMVREVWTDKGLVPRVGLSFATKISVVHTPTFKAPITMLAFAEMNQVNLQFLRPASSEVLSSSIEDVTRTVSLADNILSSELSSAETDFYRSSPEDQHNFFLSLIDMVDAVMPDPRTGERLMIHDARAQKVYFNNPTNQRLVPLASSNEDSPLILGGQMLGVSVPDIIKNGPLSHYTSPDQLLSTRTGLNFIVRPNLQSFDLSNFGNPDILMPIRGTSYGLQFQQ